jgi:hypothetical protein
MLYVISHCGSQELVHVGKKIATEPKDVAEVQADGDELSYIVGEMKNVPYSLNKRVQRWFGDMAQHIVANFY